MANLGRFLRLRFLFIALLIVGGAVWLFLFWGNAAAKEEEAKLGRELSAARKQLIAAEEETDLERLRGELEEVRSHLPTEAQAEHVGSQLWQYAKESDLSVTRFDFTRISADTEGKPPALANAFESEGETGPVVAFLKALSQLSPSPVVQVLRIAELETKEGIWHLELDLATYYR